MSVNVPPRSIAKVQTRSTPPLEQMRPALSIRFCRLPRRDSVNLKESGEHRVEVARPFGGAELHRDAEEEQLVEVAEHHLEKHLRGLQRIVDGEVALFNLPGEIFGHFRLAVRWPSLVQLAAQLGLGERSLEQRDTLGIDDLVEHIFGDLAKRLARRLVSRNRAVDGLADRRAAIADERAEQARLALEHLVQGRERAARPADDVVQRRRFITFLEEQVVCRFEDGLAADFTLFLAMAAHRNRHFIFIPSKCRLTCSVTYITRMNPA